MPRTSLAKMSIANLKQEIELRQKILPKLIAQRDALNREIAELQGATPPKASKPAKRRAAAAGAAKPRRLPKNKVNLADSLAAYMKGKAKVTIGEAMEGVLAAGYKTTSETFRSVVNNMLLADKRFKKVSRGEFTLKA